MFELPVATGLQASSKPNVVTIPGHAGDDAPVGTLKLILRAAGLEEKK